MIATPSSATMDRIRMRQARRPPLPAGPTRGADAVSGVSGPATETCPFTVSGICPPLVRAAQRARVACRILIRAECNPLALTAALGESAANSAVPSGLALIEQYVIFRLHRVIVPNDSGIRKWPTFGSWLG